MSVLVRFTPTNVTKEKYDESLRRLKEAGEFPPDGMEVPRCLRAGGEHARQRDLGLSRAVAGVR